MTIAVIVPVWNEAEALRATMASIIREHPRETKPASSDSMNTGSRDPGLELIVADGGSDDGSAGIAREAGAQVIASPRRQRAAQMNLGAEAAMGDVMLFLHADTLLPAGWARVLANAFAHDPKLVGGAFRRRFVPGSRFLRFTCAAADVRGRCLGWFLGDQAIFVRREIFRELGGFAPLPVCEDLDFTRRLARRGRVRLLKETVHTSDRRFHRRGALRQSLADLVTAIRFLCEQRNRKSRE